MTREHAVWERNLQAEISRIQAEISRLRHRTVQPDAPHDALPLHQSRQAVGTKNWHYPVGIEVHPPRPEDHDTATDIYMHGMDRKHFRTHTPDHRRWKTEKI
jgi:hypothetical protein